MKRKNACFIEVIEDPEDSNPSELKVKKYSEMPSPAEWLTTLKNAEKTSFMCDKIQKVHYKFADTSEMVEEYNIDTFCVIRRAWKKPGSLGGSGEWEVDVGEPNVESLKSSEPPADFKEADGQPTLLKRNTRINLEWRIRNLPYPIEIYSIAADADGQSIIVRTTNKKYYKRLSVGELSRIGVRVVQANIEYTHKFNTLIITYKKPKDLLDLEKAWVLEVKKIKCGNEDSIGDCHPS